MARSDLTKLHKELRILGDKMEDLTGACLGTNISQEAQSTLMVALHAEIMDQFEGLEDSVAALTDNSNGSSDDGETIERLEKELDYQNSKITDTRDARRVNEISRNHNNYTDSRELTPFAAARDIYNKEIRGFPRSLHELRSLQYHELSLCLQAVGLPITGDHSTRLFRLADYIGVGHKLFTLTWKDVQFD